MPNKSELAILKLLSDNPRLTRRELTAQVGLSENGVKKIISSLKEADLIERNGSNKTGYERQI